MDPDGDEPERNGQVGRKNGEGGNLPVHPPARHRLPCGEGEDARFVWARPAEGLATRSSNRGWLVLHAGWLEEPTEQGFWQARHQGRHEVAPSQLRAETQRRAA